MTASQPSQRRVSPVPPQHGAWAFLGLPLAVGLTLCTWTPLLIVLAVGWIAAYPAAYFVLAIAKEASARRPDPGRFRGPLNLWSSVAIPCAMVLVWFRPWLVWIGVLYLVGLAVSLGFARRRDERALLNDTVFVAQCAGMVVVTWAVSVGESTWIPPSPATAPPGLWILTVSTALVLAGSTLHVKSLIRERADLRYRTASRWFAAGSLLAAIPLAALWGLPGSALLPLPFAYLAARSLLMRGTAPRPARIGVIELPGFLLLVLAAAVGATS